MAARRPTVQCPFPEPAPLCSQGLADVCIDDSWMGGGGSVDGKGKPRNEIAAEIGKWAGIVADVLGFVPSFLCPVCTGASFIFGLLSVLGYALAKMWERLLPSPSQRSLAQSSESRCEGDEGNCSKLRVADGLLRETPRQSWPTTPPGHSHFD